MKPLHIIHLGKFFAPEHGGMESFVRDLAMAQAEAGHHVTVLVHTAGVADDFMLHPRLRVIRRASAFSLGKYAPVSLGLPLTLLKLLTEKPHILHIHSPNAAALWPAFMPWLNTPIVVHWHADVEFPKGFGPSPLLLRGWRMVEKCLLHKAAMVVATSQSYQAASPWLGPWQSKCRVVPLGLAEQRAEPVENLAARFLLSKNVEEISLLAVGRLSFYKGFSFLVEAMQYLPKARLALVGEGEERPALEAQIARLGLQERIILAGELAEVESCLDACDALVLPSINRSEAFGLVLLEAMRAGKPCVAVHVPGSGMAEVVRHQVNGLLVPPGNAKALAEAVMRIAENPLQRELMGQQGKIVFLEAYSMGNVERKLTGIYQEILARQERNR